MKITDNKISTKLENIDRFMDYCGLSCINNLVNSVTKVCMKIYTLCWGEDALKEKCSRSSLNTYWTYIYKKEKSTCALGLIPIVGSVLILAKKRWDDSQKPENNSPKYPVITLEEMEEEELR